MIDRIPVFGTHDENTLEQLRDVASRAKYAALMADGHRGYVMPIGGVAAYENEIPPTGVGFDIACGNAAILTNLVYDDVKADLPRLADEIQKTIAFGIGRKNASDDAPTDDPLFDAPEWAALPAGVNEQNLKGKARSQLGTVGSGNHYVDVFADERDRVWVGVHFGSRGLGWTIANGFLGLAQGLPWDGHAPETAVTVRLDTLLGAGYWAMMQLAGRYAYAGREWVARKVVSILGGTELDLVHNHHNFAWEEEHFGAKLIVVRKGATPAFPGQRGFVGGSMGDNSVILEGAATIPLRSLADQKLSMYSTVHGAGRVLGRAAAIKGAPILGPDGKPTGLRDKHTMVTRQMQHEWITERGVIVRGGGVDESPHVYRRLPDVLREQGDTVTVLHTLKPLVVVMAGERDHDPYKD